MRILMKIIWKSRSRSDEDGRGQAMTEFMLVLPVLLLTIFVIIELARLLFAWLAVENAARFGLRYVVTGKYNPAHYNVTDCNAFYSQFGSSCTASDTAKLENAARVLSARDAALAGSFGVQRNPSLNPVTDWNQTGLFKITVCSASATSYTAPNPDNFATDWTAKCLPNDFAGAPGDRVWVTVSFNHPVILPFISQVWPMLHLVGRRDGIVERFRTSRVIGAGSFAAPPTNTPTATDTPTITPTATATLCKVPPVVNIVSPASGATYTQFDSLPAQATAYDPDNVNPATCSGVGADGLGIVQVQFRFYWDDGVLEHYMYGSNEGVVAYCGFGGNSPCATLDLSTGVWPNGTTIMSGRHILRVRAEDDEGTWSGWQEVVFYINVPPTPTPTLTPTPSCAGVSFGSFYMDNGAVFRQMITNTTYPGLQVTGVTIDWSPLSSASSLYGWNEYLNWIEWSGTRIRDTNSTSSVVGSNKNTPRPVAVGVNANTIRVNFDGGFNGYLSGGPLYLNSSNFGISVSFSDPACNLYRSANSTSFATPTQTRTPTPVPPPSNTPLPSNTPTITNTPLPTNTPTRTPTASKTPTPSKTPTRTNTPTPSKTPTRTNTPPATATPTPTDTPQPITD